MRGSSLIARTNHAFAILFSGVPTVSCRPIFILGNARSLAGEQAGRRETWRKSGVKTMNRTRKICLLAAVSALALASSAQAQVADPRAAAISSDSPQVTEIVVTAQKRQQNLADVPISVAVIGSQQLQQAGVRSTEDLYKVVPGLSFTETQFDAPVFTLRGVGFNDSSLAAAPTVSVYVDQVPLPYSAMTRGGMLDLDHVEILKGPQGTLFGENSTGGAINFIAAKPTAVFAAGADVSYGSYNTVNAQGFVSGPIADGLTARLAISDDESGPWQQSTTRNASLGATHVFTGRLLLDYRPSDKLKIEVNLNGWHDGSDTQAAQFVGLFAAVPGPLPATIANEPVVTSPRAADWTPGMPFRRNNSFYQGSVRADWSLAPELTITSITAYEHFDRRGLEDASGTPTQDLNLGVGGNIATFDQELRLAGDYDRLHWVVGGNYEDDKIHDHQVVFLQDSPASFVGPFQYKTVVDDSLNSVKTTAIFGNVDYRITGGLSAIAGVRYTQSDTSYTGCSLDSGAGDLSNLFGFLQSAVLNVPVTTRPGACVTLLPNNSTGEFIDSLNQDNVSWRLGLNYKLETGALLYGNISRGYKAGGFPTLGASSSNQLQPVTQEELTAYELGIKTPLFDRTVQLSGAVFYYDYGNKQFSGRVQDPIFGQLQKLVNIPRSEVKGAEAAIEWVPVRGLNISGSATYLDTQIDKDPGGGDFINYTEFGTLQSFTGHSFPYTPRWQLNASINYEWPISSKYDAFAGGDIAYRSATNGSLEEDPRLKIDAYSLINLSAGLKTPDGRWRLAAYGKNVANTYYWNNAIHVQDTIVRYTGMPAQYGVILSYRY
jgi:iron complex outermembrane recepter protein